MMHTHGTTFKNMLPIFSASRIKISFITFSCISFIHKSYNSEWPMFPFGNMQNLYEEERSCTPLQVDQFDIRYL